MLLILKLLAFLVITVHYAASQAATSAIIANISTDQWLGQSGPMDPRIVSLSVETNSFQDYFPGKSANNGSPTLTDNLLKQLSTSTGVYPAIRVGGITGNRAFFNQSLVNPFFTGNSFGPGIYETAPNYTDIKWVMMVPLHPDHLARDGLDLAEFIVTTMGNSLERIELGNEPDNVGITPPIWVEKVQALASAIGEAIPSQKGTLQINVGGYHPDFTLTSLVNNNGLLSGNGSTDFGVWGGHQYGLTACGSSPTIDQLLNVSNIESNLATHNADVALAKQKNLIFDFGESNSVSCGGFSGVTDTVAQGLWVIHFVFHSAILGVRRIYFHMGSGGYNGRYAYYVPWSTSLNYVEPGAALVKPMYHAMLLLNDAIGNKKTSVQHFETSNLNSTTPDPDLHAYGLFEGTQWVRTVFVNTHNNSDPAKIITVPGSNCHSRVFTGPSINAKLNATYAGQSYDTADGTPVNSYQQVEGCNVTIPSASAVLVFHS